MQAAGYPFADQLEARRYVTRRIETEVGNPNDVDERAQAALADITEEERKIAGHDARCQQETGDVFADVWADHVTTFIGDNAALIDGLLGAG